MAYGPCPTGIAPRQGIELKVIHPNGSTKSMFVLAPATTVARLKSKISTECALEAGNSTGQIEWSTHRLTAPAMGDPQFEDESLLLTEAGIEDHDAVVIERI